MSTSSSKPTSPLRAALRRILAGLRVARGYFPLTWLGAFVLGASIASLVYFAFDEIDLVALVLGWGAVALVALAFLLVTLAGTWLALLTREIASGSPVRGTTEAPIPTGFSIPALAWAPLLTFDVDVIAPASFRRTLRTEDGRRLETLETELRGRFERVVRRYSVGDVFGLMRMDFVRAEARDLLITPHLGRLAQMPTLHSLAQGDALAHPTGAPDGDRLDIRRYAPGDSARFIHWKIFARSRKLAVRVPERALAPSRRVVAYLVAGSGDEASAAAALAAVRFGALGDDWSFGADGSPQPTSEVDAAMVAIAASAAHRADGARDLDAFVRAAERRGPTSVVLFVPPEPGPWLDRVLSLPQVRDTPMQIVLGVDAIHEPASRSGLARVVASVGVARGTARADLDAVRSRLARSGAHLLVVERPTGRVLATHGELALSLRGRAA